MSNVKQALTEPNYQNYAIYSPDDVLMAYVKRKNVEWYIKRDLADWISEKAIRLKFAPKGLGNHKDLYALGHKENRCVVCGTEHNLTRHHVIPTLYKKHFPLEFKERTSHDIVLVCVKHHHEYERYADRLKRMLSQSYEVPFDDGFEAYRMLDRVVCVAHTLLNHGAKIPFNRVCELEQEIKDHLKKDSLTKEDIAMMADKSLLKHVEFTHGKRVIDKVDNLQEFAEMWRQHFLDYAKPLYMPDHWDVKRKLGKLN